MLRPLPAPRRRRMQDDRLRSLLRLHRGVLAQIDPGRNDLGVRHPSERVVRADDPRVRSVRVPKLLRRLPTDVRAEEVEHRAPPRRLQDRPGELPRDERPAEVEVEDVSARQQPEERRPLNCLPPPEAGRAVERAVRLRMQLLALDDDQLRVDALAPECLHVRPRDPRHVQRGMNDSQSSHSTWSK